MRLNGAGLRSKLFFKVYVGALYAGEKSTSASALIDAKGLRRMRLHILRELEADSFHAALDEGMRNNLPPAQLSALQPRIDQLGTLMRALGKVRPGMSLISTFPAPASPCCATIKTPVWWQGPTLPRPCSKCGWAINRQMQR